MDNEDNQPQDPLDQFVGLFNSPGGQAFAEEAKTRINGYLTARSIANANTAAGQAFTDNLAEMRGNLIGMTQDDPASTHLALDLAHLGVSAMVGSIPGADPEHLDNISTGMQRDIARASVHNLAEKDDGLARELLDQPRVAGLLGDEREPLHGYINAQSVARRIDAQGAQKMAQRDAVNQANTTAWDYMSVVVDPDTGAISHPPGWAGKVMADTSLPPPMKAALFDTYGRLQEFGDAGSSDAGSVRNVVQGALDGSASPVQILARAGDDLRAADAVYLAKLANDPYQKGRLGQIDATLHAAEQTLATPENGAAGQVAFERFANWLIPTARDGADLNPSSKEYILSGNRMQMFAPRATDVADYVVGEYNRQIWGTEPYAEDPKSAERQNFPDRMSLQDIFSGRGRARVSGDPVIETLPKPPVGMPWTDYGTEGEHGAAGGNRFAAPGGRQPGRASKNPPGDRVLPPSSDNVAVR